MTNNFSASGMGQTAENLAQRYNISLRRGWAGCGDYSGKCVICPGLIDNFIANFYRASNC